MRTRPLGATIDLAIVIVSWNVWDLLRACLRSIEAESVLDQSLGRSSAVRRFGPEGRAALQVIVVDNASDDATPQLLRSQFPWVQAILSPENLGFTGGNNLALTALGLKTLDTQLTGAQFTGAQFTGAQLTDDPTPHPTPQRADAAPPPHFVTFLNPDTELLPGSLWALYQAIQGDERLGAAGPLVRYGDGSLQSTRRRFPSPLTGFFESTWLGQMWPNNPWAKRYHVTDWPANQRQDVDWLVGAALTVRWAALAQVGGFDPDFFMYSEEMDLCRRIKQAGWRVVYDPSATVIHYEGRSSEQASTRRHVLFNRSKVRYYRKWFGPVWAALLRRYLLLEFYVQIWLERAKALLGHKRTMRQERVAAYREVIDSSRDW